MFNALMSSLVARVSGEFFSYTSKPLPAIAFSDTEFRNLYIFYKAFYEIVNVNYFDRVIDIFYEDMIDDPKISI